MTDKHMFIGIEFGKGYGSQSGSWRTPWVDPTNYTSFDARVHYAQAAEHGKLQFLFLPGWSSHATDNEAERITGRVIRANSRRSPTSRFFSPHI